MYKSPIEKIYGDIQTQMAQEDENMAMKAIRQVGVNVDKEELIKALQYDRNQYAKGYDDGKNEILDKIRAEIEKLQKMCDKNDLNLMAQYSAFGMVLEDIDKYKAESEEKEE